MLAIWQIPICFILSYNMLVILVVDVVAVVVFWWVWRASGKRVNGGRRRFSENIFSGISSNSGITTCNGLTRGIRQINNCIPLDVWCDVILGTRFLPAEKWANCFFNINNVMYIISCITPTGNTSWSNDFWWSSVYSLRFGCEMRDDAKKKKDFWEPGSFALLLLILRLWLPSVSCLLFSTTYNCSKLWWRRWQVGGGGVCGSSLSISF